MPQIFDHFPFSPAPSRLRTAPSFSAQHPNICQLPCTLIPHITPSNPRRFVHPTYQLGPSLRTTFCITYAQIDGPPTTFLPDFSGCSCSRCFTCAALVAAVSSQFLRTNAPLSAQVEPRPLFPGCRFWFNTLRIFCTPPAPNDAHQREIPWLLSRTELALPPARDVIFLRPFTPTSQLLLLFFCRLFLQHFRNFCPGLAAPIAVAAASNGCTSWPTHAPQTAPVFNHRLVI